MLFCLVLISRILKAQITSELQRIAILPKFSSEVGDAAQAEADAAARASAQARAREEAEGVQKALADTQARQKVNDDARGSSQAEAYASAGGNKKAEVNAGAQQSHQHPASDNGPLNITAEEAHILPKDATAAWDFDTSDPDELAFKVSDAPMCCVCVRKLCVCLPVHL